MAYFPEPGDPGRDNRTLNEEIERTIDAWDGTAHGIAVRNMYENGSSYEAICDFLGIDQKDYED